MGKIGKKQNHRRNLLHNERWPTTHVTIYSYSQADMYPYSKIAIYTLNNGLCVTKITGTTANSEQPKGCDTFRGAVIGGRKAVQAVSPLFGAEQAEVGQSPTCLPLRYRYRGFK